MTDAGPAVIITDGSLGSLVAAWTEEVRTSRSQIAGARAGAMTAWFDARGPARLRRRAAVERLVSMGVFQGVLGDGRDHHPTTDDARSRTRSERAAVTDLLLGAARAAAGLGASRVIWPEQCVGTSGEPDLDRIAAAADRALLVGELVSLEIGRSEGVVIELPFIDFSDIQLMELAVDLDVPMDACWWCREESDAPTDPGEPCGRCSACERWQQAGRQAGAGFAMAQA